MVVGPCLRSAVRSTPACPVRPPREQRGAVELPTWTPRRCTIVLGKRMHVQEKWLAEPAQSGGES